MNFENYKPNIDNLPNSHIDPINDLSPEKSQTNKYKTEYKVKGQNLNKALSEIAEDQIYGVNNSYLEEMKIINNKKNRTEKYTTPNILSSPNEEPEGDNQEMPPEDVKDFSEVFSLIRSKGIFYSINRFT